MKTTGEKIIDAIVARLNDTDVRCHDSAIVGKLRNLTAEEVQQLCAFGDVTAWHNDRTEKKRLAETGLL